MCSAESIEPKTVSNSPRRDAMLAIDEESLHIDALHDLCKGFQRFAVWFSATIRIQRKNRDDIGVEQQCICIVPTYSINILFGNSKSMFVHCNSDSVIDIISVQGRHVCAVADLYLDGAAAEVD